MTNATNPMTSPMTNASADGTGSTTADDATATDATTAPATTTVGDTTDGTTTDVNTSEGSSSSGEPPAVSYPPCMPEADPPCPEPFTLCWPPPEFGEGNFCTIECMDVGECPEPTSGTAVPVCEGPPGSNACNLDCTEGDCPDGMDCVDIFGNGQFMRCNYP